MAFFKSGNPTLSEKRFKDTILDEVVTHENAMTVRGTLNKFGFLFLMVMGTAFYSWKEAAGGGNVMPLILIGAFGGLGVAIVLIFKKEWAPYLAPAYALLEGLFVGAISAQYNAAFAEQAPNLIINAVGLTFGTAIAMYLLYSFKIIRATEKFKAIVITATAGIAIFYLLTWVLGFFGINFAFLRTAAQGLATRSNVYLLQGDPDAALRDMMLIKRIADFNDASPGSLIQPVHKFAGLCNADETSCGARY